MTAAIMFQGTGSNVGKSLITAGLCRAFTRRGLRVRPFKPQNMSNNAAVTIEGGEIGRAQALQARACGVEPSVQMNPILLKPETETGAQVVVRGERTRSLKAREYMNQREAYLPAVLECFHSLQREADLILVEGAGSPAEINLRRGDIANMGFALKAKVPVALVGDIHRGGVIASIAGTMDIIDTSDRAAIRTFAINNFHGDTSLFEEGRDFLVERCGIPCAGVVPHFANAVRLPAEDAVALEEPLLDQPAGRLKIAVPRLSRIANFDDLDPLRLEPDVQVEIVQPGQPLPGDAELLLIPGSKATIGDLADFRAQGWDIDLAAHIRRGGRVIGLCGGYQMLGMRLHDPDGIEGPAGSIDGLGYLDVETTLTPAKALRHVSAQHADTGAQFEGYEMHIGRTTGPDRDRPFAFVDGAPEGAVTADGLIAGTYLHGVFTSDGFRGRYLTGLGAEADQTLSFGNAVNRTLDELAEHLEEHLDCDLLLSIAQEGL